MKKQMVLLALLLCATPAWAQQTRAQQCAALGLPQDCTLPNQELQREELINLEKEGARAIQQNNGTFFRRVYADDFRGTLSHGQAVSKNDFINVIQSADVKYEFFNASDIDVHIYLDVAVVTCLWSSRAIIGGQKISSQYRVMHVYYNGSRGWHAVAGQETVLPPGGRVPL